LPKILPGEMLSNMCQGKEVTIYGKYKKPKHVLAWKAPTFIVGCELFPYKQKDLKERVVLFSFMNKVDRHEATLCFKKDLKPEVPAILVKALTAYHDGVKKGGDGVYPPVSEKRKATA
jgi:hypothetical protein